MSSCYEYQHSGCTLDERLTSKMVIAEVYDSCPALLTTAREHCARHRGVSNRGAWSVHTARGGGGCATGLWLGQGPSDFDRRCCSSHAPHRSHPTQSLLLMFGRSFLTPVAPVHLSINLISSENSMSFSTLQCCSYSGDCYVVRCIRSKATLHFAHG